MIRTEARATRTIYARARMPGSGKCLLEEAPSTSDSECGPEHNHNQKFSIVRLFKRAHSRNIPFQNGFTISCVSDWLQLG
jgi:hypothetical protein